MNLYTWKQKLLATFVGLAVFAIAIEVSLMVYVTIGIIHLWAYALSTMP